MLARSMTSLGTPANPGLPVEGGKSYTYSYWVKADGAPDGLVIATQAYWYRADKSYIKHDGFGVLKTGKEFDPAIAMGK